MLNPATQIPRPIAIPLTAWLQNEFFSTVSSFVDRAVPRRARRSTRLSYLLMNLFK
jgi:hypothetical protein